MLRSTVVNMQGWFIELYFSFKNSLLFIICGFNVNKMVIFIGMITIYASQSQICTKIIFENSRLNTEHQISNDVLSELGIWWYSIPVTEAAIY